MAGLNIWIFYGLPLLLLLECTAFNLDHESVLRKNGEPGSFFGFSMAMHWQLRPSDKRMLLVGAPRAGPLSMQKAKVPGGLYNCDFTNPSETCERVNFDNDEDLSKESKENQWMGVTVNSQGPGGKIVTCAHRYQTRNNVGKEIETRNIIGRCYVMSQDLTMNPKDNEDNGNWHFCNGRNYGHERFGSCQQGLSATFDKEYHYLIFGAPGAYNWKGVVRLEQNNNTLVEMGIYQDGPFETGNERELRADLVPVPPTSYLGFSLDSSKSLVVKERLTVVAGAPRANHSGAVVLLTIDNDSSMREEFTLQGEGLASSFGYDLAVLDLNQDGWHDIVVGAPQYFEKDGKIGGAVYVYVNKAGAWDTVTPLRIDGPQDSMFGLSVENLGDINQDNYPDFAVGAPYDDEGAGVVYIYHGSEDGISSNKKHSQMLKGRPLGSRHFGYSLAGNMDLDRNTYPDLAVGSLSDSVFVFRARPVVDIIKKITITPPELDLTKKNCGDKICLTVSGCFSYVASAANYNPKLSVRYKLVVEDQRKKAGLPSRVVITQASSSGSNFEISGLLKLTKQNQQSCLEWKLTLQDDIRDKLRGIPIEVFVDIQDSARRRRQASGAELKPVLDADKPKSIRSEVSFLKEGCGADNVCQSKMVVGYRFCRKKPNQDVFEPLHLDSSGVPVLSLSNEKEIALEVTVTNVEGDDAYEASINATFPKALSYSSYRVLSKYIQPVTCKANKDGSMAECELGNPFKRDAKVTFYIILSTAGISLNTTELEIDLTLDTTSDQKERKPIKARAKVVIELLLSLSGQAQPSQLYYTGKVVGESAMKTESDIGSAIKYIFRIINLGKPLKNIGSASLVVRWPKENAHGKWLLYLMGISSDGLDKVNCSPAGEINPKGVKKEPSTNRKRRAIGDKSIKEGSTSQLTDVRKSETLSCGSGASCVEFQCPLLGLDSNAALMFHARLWNGTLIEEYSKLNYLDIIVKASLKVVIAGQEMALKNSETQVKVTVFPERRGYQTGGLPWWIILVAILLGLLLLALLIFLLWKCGFFKRTKHEDTVPSYNAVRIKREVRDGRAGQQDHWENLEKKPWTRSWKDNQHHS
ncbi:integrin alpha-6 isoform X1 [Gadus morhua]|uniref:Integrin alpha-6-like n=1 Tax=Gadus morhua TaxID=8049 RepID=A0A8C4ZRE7_GADMO|nr:integrin alpha-6-like isoform X1 [Gadus morhua]